MGVQQQLLLHAAKDFHSTFPRGRFQGGAEGAAAGRALRLAAHVGERLAPAPHHDGAVCQYTSRANKVTTLTKHRR